MGVGESYARLTRADKDLFACWNQTAGSWRDENRRQFEKTCLSLIRSELRKTKLALEHIDTVLNQVRRDCR